MIKEPPPMEKRSETELSAKDYQEIGRQMLKVDKNLARAYFREAGLPKEEIQKIFVESAKTEQKSDKEEPILPAEEKRKLFGKIADDFEEKFRQTGKNEYFDLARTYRRAAENLESKE